MNNHHRSQALDKSGEGSVQIGSAGQRPTFFSDVHTLDIGCRRPDALLLTPEEPACILTQMVGNGDRRIKLTLGNPGISSTGQKPVQHHQM